jgi:hypothetical protein
MDSSSRLGAYGRTMSSLLGVPPLFPLGEQTPTTFLSAFVLLLFQSKLGDPTVSQVVQQHIFNN